MIKEVSYLVAKLLKEKGFDLEVSCYYNNHPPKNGHLRGLIKGTATHGVIQDHNGETEGDDLICSAPTIAEVVMWLYEKHSIWVCIDKAEDFDWWKFNIRMLKDVGYLYGGFGSDFNSPTEAYEAAINYCLINLI